MFIREKRIKWPGQPGRQICLEFAAQALTKEGRLLGFDASALVLAIVDNRGHKDKTIEEVAQAIWLQLTEKLIASRELDRVQVTAVIVESDTDRVVFQPSEDWEVSRGG